MLFVLLRTGWSISIEAERSFSFSRLYNTFESKKKKIIIIIIIIMMMKKNEREVQAFLKRADGVTPLLYASVDSTMLLSTLTTRTSRQLIARALLPDKHGLIFL